METAQVPQPMIPLPRYLSHKKVWALKIKDIQETDGGAMITPENGRYAPFKVLHNYLDKHNPQIGGYYVQYPDGYISWSPADAF